MQGKFKLELNPHLYGVLKVSLDVPANVRSVGAMLGYGDQEIENLVGQKFQEIIDYFSLEEQP